MKIKSNVLGGLVLSFIATSFFAAASFAAVAEESVVTSGKIQEINQQIKKQGAKWQAKENWVSKLSQKELKRMLGSNDMPTSTLDYHSDAAKAATLPASWDWRNQNGLDWLGPVMNQGNCGSCVAFSTVATLEAQVSIASGLPWLHPNFSPDQLFACGGATCDSGWAPASAAKFLKSKGIVDAACAPDVMGSTGTDISCAQATVGCPDFAARTYKISGITTPSKSILGGGSGNVDAVKEALTHGPLVTTLTVYSDFLTYSGGIYKNVSGKAEGGHAVSIVGYDTATRVWIVRNSWGPNWGENGFVRVSWDDKSGVGSNTWQFQLPAKTEYLTIASPAENEYVSGQVQAKVGTNSTANLNVDIRKAGTRAVITTLSCVQSGTAGCVSALDTTTLADGHYEMVAKTGAANGFSEVRSFYVVNQVPQTLGISFQGHDVDLTQAVSDRIEFDLTTLTSSVPFHSVTLLLLQNGQIVASRETDVVLPSMTVGFRTNVLPNGSYQLLFRGELSAAGKVITADSKPVTLQFKN
jgi:hypothetical protein